MHTAQPSSMTMGKDTLPQILHIYKHVQVVVTHITSLDCLIVTDRGLQVRPGFGSSAADTASGVPGSGSGGGGGSVSGDAMLREHDLVVELAGEWTVGICADEWTGLAASLAAHQLKQIVLLRYVTPTQSDFLLRYVIPAQADCPPAVRNTSSSRLSSCGTFLPEVGTQHKLPRQCDNVFRP